MQEYDFGVSWNWVGDKELTEDLNRICQEHGKTCFIVHGYNLRDTYQKVISDELRIHTFLDRASDSDDDFGVLSLALMEKGTRFINPLSQMLWSKDKARMHLEFITHGLQTPYTQILLPYEDAPLAPDIDLKKLGVPFVIKPAVGGGGVGVVTDAKDASDIIRLRQKEKHVKYLIQEKIIPREIGGRPAWFRVIRAFEKMFPFFWNPETKIYTPLTPADLEREYLLPLLEITKKISTISTLNVFSTEIAQQDSGRYVIVDYVNDPIDLRKQSICKDGVPNEVVTRICELIIKHIDDIRHEPEKLYVYIPTFS